MTQLHRDLPESISPANELQCRTLIVIWRQEYLLFQGRTESIDPACEVQLPQDLKLPLVHSHVVILIEINKTCIERTVIRR